MIIRTLVLAALLAACAAPAVAPPGGETSTTAPTGGASTTARPTQTPSPGASATSPPATQSASEEPGAVGSNPPTPSMGPPTPASSADDEPTPHDSPIPTNESEPSLPPDALGFATIANRLFSFTESPLCSVSDDALRVIVNTADGGGQMVIQWLFDGSIRGPFSITDAEAGITWQAGPTFLGTENPPFFIDGSTVTFNGPMRATSGLGDEGTLEHANLRVTCP